MIGEEEKQAVLRVMERGILSGYMGNWSEAFYGGPECQALEKEWAEYFNVKHAIVTNSATSGLWLACSAIGLKPGDECITTPYSMTCSASIPLHFGAKPVFADIEPNYFCLDPEAVEKAITPRTKAIIVVDLFGQPYAADEINAIAKKHGIYVIEDAAQAAGAKYKGRYAGTLGDIGVFSLNVHKHIQCGEGGVVVTDNDELAQKMRLLANHAEAVVNDMYVKKNAKLVLSEENKALPLLSLVGMNLRMTELQAAIAREQLKKLAGILGVVKGKAGHFPVKIRPECGHAFYRYAWLDSGLVGWDHGEEMNYKFHYITPLYKLPLFKSLGYPDNLCPVCERVEENIVLAWLKETP